MSRMHNQWIFEMKLEDEEVIHARNEQSIDLAKETKDEEGVTSQGCTV